MLAWQLLYVLVSGGTNSGQEFRPSMQSEFLSVAFDVVLEFDIFLVTTGSQVFCHVNKVILRSVRIEPKILRDTDMRMEEEF